MIKLNSKATKSNRNNSRDIYWAYHVSGSTVSLNDIDTMNL